MLSTSPNTASLSYLQDYLEQNHRLFWNLLLSRDEALWKQLSSSSSGTTIFAVTDDAMQQNVGPAQLAQLQDIRNQEAVGQMAAYHAVNEYVSAEQLFESGGVVPLSGNAVLIERGMTGGLFGMGGKEDGSVTIGGRAKVLESVEIPGQPCSSVVHRVDNMISPSVLWRYCDQLRIPGSK